MTSSVFQATLRTADGLSETKKEEHDQLSIGRPCLQCRRMTLISSARAPVDGEADGVAEPGVKWLRLLTVLARLNDSLVCAW